MSNLSDMRKIEVVIEIIESENVSEEKIVKDNFFQIIDLVEISETKMKVSMFFGL